jgi:alkanesulfonate monooxygenase SsuD/methylene tetrahydromethanopterin reductase-like flavin-dependent oxidoreductase (luciferase family)
MTDFEVVLPVFAVASDSEEERAGGAAMVRSQIGFYGSTPAYRPVLELHGWGELGDELNGLVREDGWLRLAEVIPDEVLSTFAVIGTPEAVVEELRARFGDIVTRIQLKLPSDLDPDRRAGLLAALRAPVAGVGA